MKQTLIDIKQYGEDDFARWYLAMQPQRKEKCLRLKQEIARKRCIAADHLVRTVLSEELNRPAEEIVIEVSPSGKPYLSGNPVYFSVSHSGTMVACVCSDSPVGIDVEQIRPVLTSAQERICTTEEWEYLRNADDEAERNLRFFYLWTRKEAVFKADGILPRRDQETNVLTPKHGWNVESRIEKGYYISVAEKWRKEG